MIKSGFNQDFSKTRLRVIAIIVFIFGFVLVYRLFYLQVTNSQELKEAALAQQATVRSIPASRGSIYYGEAKSNQTYPLAANREFNHLFAVPSKIENPKQAFNLLWPLLEDFGMSEETLRARLEKENDIYEPLAHKLTDEELEKFRKLEIPGIAWEKETWRYYPEGDTLANVLGFVGIRDDKRTGQYGLEGFFEEELKGKDGLVEGATDIYGRVIQSADLAQTKPEVGVDLYLTVDRNIQTFACQRLKESVEKHSAASGQVIVMNPETGAILALCNEPAYNPNFYNKVEDISVYLNPAVSTAYEPGSTFKPLTMAAAIEDRQLEPETIYTDTGEVKIGKYTIRNSDSKAHGEVSMITVLQDSLNTGAIFAQQKIGNNRFRKFVEKFGFGSLTEIDLGGEVAGDISSLEKSSDVFFATASFGQGITTTPLQMLSAYASLANGGNLVKPFIVKEKRRNGSLVSVTQPEFIGEPISVRTSTIISGMLVSVVKDGQAKRAGVPGYHIAGKTGTAQVAEAGGYGEDTIQSYVGYGPVEDPVFVMLTKLDYPQVDYFAASTAAPLFGEIAEFILQYYEIPPNE